VGTVRAAGYPTIDGQFSGTGSIGAGQTVDLQVTGRGGVPATGVGAVALNVTVTNTTAPSYLTVFPAGAGVPKASNLNFAAGQTVPNMVVSKVGDGGRVSLFNLSGNVDVVVDVLGWLPTGAAYTAVTPERVLDTRVGEPTVDAQYSGVGKVGSAAQLTLPIGGRASVPTSADSVVLNVTVTNPTVSSYLSLWPSGSARPTAANLNFVPGQTVSNMAMVRLGPDSSVSIFNLTGSVDVVVDVLGYFPGSGTFNGITPARLMDTRPTGITIDDQFVATGAVGPQGVVTLDVTGRGGVPATGVGAVALNVTVTEPTAPSFLTVWPTGQTRPTASNLNFVTGQTVPNMVVADVGDGGNVSLYNLAGSTHVVVDVLGWFPSGGGYTGLTPARLMDTRTVPETPPPVVTVPGATLPPPPVNPSDPSLDPFVCRTYTQHAVGNAPLPDNRNEISGMARGRTDRSVLWVHEDSGAQPEVHALSLTGQYRQTFKLTGATNRDWEDMDVGPGPVVGVNYLYLGDIGGNFAAGNDITIWRVPEPKVTDTGASTNLAGAVGIVGRFPGGIHPNSESMAVGADGTIYVITKSLPTKVYAIPFPQTTGINNMIEIAAGTLGPKQYVSWADIRPDGRALIVRGYRDAWTWPIVLGESMATTLSRTPCSTPTFHDEPQGEAIGFLGNDGSYTSTGEVDPVIRQYTL
ncbi:MAG: Beta-lactamase class, partial [Ilumatobacteraceae bacterium]|nr:Beta-lactamase class [Ilumatobacteraceae bacterium]